MMRVAWLAGNSLRLRLALALLLWIIAGIAVIGFSTSALFRRHVEAQFHDELQVHLEELAMLTRLAPDGTPYLDRPLSDPRYSVPGSGFYFQVERDGVRPLKSASMPRGALDPSLAHQPDVVHRLAPGPTGPTMTYGFARPAADGGPELHYLIATDERVLTEVLSAFDRDLGRWLTLLALALLSSGCLVVVFAMRPFRRLGRAIADVRSGAVPRMAGTWPAEIAPLVHDVNELLDASDAMVAGARTEAGNLAHSLRTSLAILTDEAETLTRGRAGDSAATLLEQCRRIGQQLDWHLARARAAVRGGPGTAIPDAMQPIAKAMARLHAGRGVRFTLADGPPVRLAIDPEDFAEILSNLADNAGKWAASEVVIGWRLADGAADISVTDDGPGIAAEQRAAVFGVGQRLDEQTPGHGLGLAIARDLARRHGGEVVLNEREDGRCGLMAVLSIPTMTTAAISRGTTAADR